MILQSTICAVSTASGVGAIAIVRLSGADSFNIAQNLILKKELFFKLEAKKLLHTEILSSDAELIDDVLVVKFIAPSSFTGENMVEFYCHGSEFITQKLLTNLVRMGAEIAKPGEFTLRAFLNGKMDLSQSEAVADLISSNSAETHRIAIAQIKGNVSSKISELRSKMLNLTSLLELELDFSEEDVEFADRTKLLELIKNISLEINCLINTFEYGNAVKNGVPVAIIGEPNVGKSTLLNVLLQEERAIVSSIPGTTRDTIEEELVLDGIKFRFIDTAGIRKAENEIEKIGIERTFKKLKTAKVVILLLDPETESSHNDNIISEIKATVSELTKLIVVVNKSDVDKKYVPPKCVDFLSVSALKLENIDNLTFKLLEYVRSLKPESSDVIITNVRHISSLESTLSVLKSAEDSIKSGVASDFVAQDLREANYRLGEIVGEISNNEVLRNIFSKFCIGK